VRHAPPEPDAQMSEQEFRLLRDFIHERFGLFYDDSQRGGLRARLASRMALLGLRSFEDYYRHLRFAPDRAVEERRMVSHLTNNETYFFREKAQLDVFADHALRRVKERRTREGEKIIRIVSAGCSTGEEALTLAMILYDSGQFFWGWDARVVGIDVDEAALEKARRGVYYQNSLRAVTKPFLDRHFVPDGNGARVKEGSHKLVSFRAGNLLEPASYEDLSPLDVLFCRNVLIYFSDVAIQRAVQLFHDVLAPGGFLFLGHAESLARVTSAFVPIRFQGAIVYQKPVAAPA